MNKETTTEKQLDRIKAQLILNSTQHECRYFESIVSSELNVIIRYDKITGEFTFE